MKRPINHKDHKEHVTVLQTAPPIGQSNKPSELIQINGHQTLSLYSRRAITILWHNAHRQGVVPEKDYYIEISEMISGGHNGYEQATEAVIQLMQTILTIKRPDGSTSRVQFLGGNDMEAEDRAAGVLTYSFDKRLIGILQDSEIWGKISLPILMSLSSKYAVSLYENVCQWTGLTKKVSQRFTLEEFRQLLGIEGNKYSTFGELNKHVVKPITRELNAIAPFNVNILPVKTGKKVTHIRIGWWDKTDQETRDAWAEVSRPRVGRRARISNQEEHVLEPIPSLHKYTKKIT
jgi:plasmid replication initiation protein